MAQAIALAVIMFLALYGVCCILRRISLLILKPVGGVHSFSLAYLRSETENVEQIIRYFRARAEREDVLLLVDNGIAAQGKEVIRRLCDGCNNIRFITAENFVEDNCI